MTSSLVMTSPATCSSILLAGPKPPVSPSSWPRPGPDLLHCLAMLRLLNLAVFAVSLTVLVAEQRTLNVHVTTWNVKSVKNPPENFGELLGQGTGHLSPDMIILGLQEVTMNPVTAFLNKVFKDKWSLKIKELLSPEYVKVKTKVSVSVALIVYVKKDLVDSLGDIQSSSVKTGFGGLYGNKGAVIVSFRLMGRHFRIVNCHLHAFDGQMDARISDWKTIDEEREKISSEPQDYLFWIGDLNFRISDISLDADTINTLLNKGLKDELLEKDELNLAKKQEPIFYGWNEVEIKFNPTYKVTVGEGSYDLKRRPAWTDRILYKSGTGKTIVNKQYTSVEGFLGSDHKPVIAEFQLPLEG